MLNLEAARSRSRVEQDHKRDRDDDHHDVARRDSGSGGRESKRLALLEVVEREIRRVLDVALALVATAVGFVGPLFGHMGNLPAASAEQNSLLVAPSVLELVELGIAGAEGLPSAFGGIGRLILSTPPRESRATICGLLRPRPVRRQSSIRSTLDRPNGNNATKQKPGSRGRRFRFIAVATARDYGSPTLSAATMKRFRPSRESVSIVSINTPSALSARPTTVHLSQPTRGYRSGDPMVSVVKIGDLSRKVHGLPWRRRGLLRPSRVGVLGDKSRDFTPDGGHTVKDRYSDSLSQ